MIAEPHEPRPVVALVSGAPLVTEALSSALGGFAEVLALPGGQSDLRGLLDSVRPAGVVTDDPTDAAAAATYAGAAGAAILHVRIARGSLEVWNGRGWDEAAGDLSPELVRNTLLARLRDQGPAG
jgi:hypothetical protein